MKDRRTVIKSKADMDTQVRSPAGLAPPYRQVCVFAPATTTTGLPSPSYRPPPKYFAGHGCLTSRQNFSSLPLEIHQLIACSAGCLQISRRVTGHLPTSVTSTPPPLFCTRSASPALLYRRGPEFMADGGQCCLCV